MTAAPLDGARALAGGRACEAPFASMYLTPRGDVLACCFNVSHVLGNVGDESLSAIWRGERAEALRRAVAAGDLMVGCQYCAWQEAEGAVAPSRGYDRLAPGPEAPGEGRWPRRLEMALSNRCNLECTMCHGELSSRIRRRREGLPPVPVAYGDRFFAELAEVVPSLDELALLGGEPLRSPEAQRALRLVAELGARPSVHLTTNATSVPSWLPELAGELAISYTVSLDAASADRFERIRVGARFADVLANLDRLRGLCSPPDTELTVAFSLMRESWDELADVLLLAEERDVDVYVNVVVSPLGSSLLTLPADRLDEVLAALQARDAALRTRLRRNLAVWDDQLERLRAHRSSLDRGRRLHGSITVVAPPGGPGGGAGPEGDPGREESTMLDVAGPVDSLHCDGADVVLEVGSSGFLGVDATWCVGRPAVQVVHAVEARLRAEAVVVDQRRADGVDLRSYELWRPGARSPVARAQIEVAPDGRGGTRWWAAWTQAPPG